MCVAIVNNNGLISEQTFIDCDAGNHDGAGLAWVENGKLETYQCMEDVKSFYEIYKCVREVSTSPVLIHFRYATSGKVDEDNTHPFSVNDELCFIHNGVMHEVDIINKNYSDTWHFNEMLKSMPGGFLESEGIRDLIRVFIGSDKLAFLDSKGNLTIINEQLGAYDDSGNWFSNTFYLPYDDDYTGEEDKELWEYEQAQQWKEQQALLDDEEYKDNNQNFWDEQPTVKKYFN